MTTVTDLETGKVYQADLLTDVTKIVSEILGDTLQPASLYNAWKKGYDYKGRFRVEYERCEVRRRFRGGGNYVGNVRECKRKKLENKWMAEEYFKLFPAIVCLKKQYKIGCNDTWMTLFKMLKKKYGKNRIDVWHSKDDEKRAQEGKNTYDKIKVFVLYRFDQKMTLAEKVEQTKFLRDEIDQYIKEFNCEALED